MGPQSAGVAEPSLLYKFNFTNFDPTWIDDGFNYVILVTESSIRWASSGDEFVVVFFLSP